MALTIKTRTEGPVGNDATFQNRVVSQDGSGASVAYEGNCITAADVGTITCTVYDLNGLAPSTAVATPSITSSAIVALATPNEWQNRDTIGRNFQHTVSGSVFAQPDHTYRVVYKIVTTGGTALQWGHDHTANAITPA